jgi:hypothetical protein
MPVVSWHPPGIALLLLLLLLQVHLTSAGMGLAARLYRHAVESGKMQPHAQVGSSA